MPLIKEIPMQSRKHAPQTRPARHARRVLRAQRNRRRGFTLLEVLVALVVLSIGLLGIGKLVMVSSRGNDSALFRSQATALAYTMLDAMRANRDQATSGAYDVPTGAYAGAQDCVSASCDASQLVVSNIQNWKSTLSKHLPEGDGSITTAAAVGADGQTRTTATITVQWDDWVAQQSFAGALVANKMATVTLESIL